MNQQRDQYLNWQRKYF